MGKKKIPELHVERASDAGNLYYLSVLEYRKTNYLVVVDNITEDEVNAYVLDLAPQEGINLQDLLSVITNWFYKGSSKYPLSFEFSKLGINGRTNRIYKSFELVHVTRLIGQDFRFDLNASPKVKRRRVNKIPTGVEIKLKRLVDSASTNVVQLPQVCN